MSDFNFKLKKRYYSLYILSPIGLVAFWILVVFSINIVSEIRSLNQLYDEVVVQDMFQDYWPSFGTSILELTLMFMGWMYLGLFGVYKIFNRARFARLLKKGKLKFEFLSDNLSLSMSSPFRFNLSIIEAKIDLVYLSNLNEIISYQDQPRTFFKEGKFSFDLSSMPTGKYQVRSVMIYFKDPLNLFNAKFKIFNAPFDFATYTKAEKTYDNLINSRTIKDAIIPVACLDPNESFYSTREYKRGDPIKRIHWKATAKNSKFIVRLPEDSSIEDDDLNLILNLYSKTSIDSNICGEFLELSIGYIKYLAGLTHRKINFFINGETKLKLENFDKVNPEKIVKIVLESSVFQDKTNLEKFLDSEEISKAVVFSLPLDRLDDPKIEAIYSMYLSQKLKTSLASMIKNLYVYKKDIKFGPNIADSFVMKNPIVQLQKWSKNQQIKTIIYDNEKLFDKSHKFYDLET